MVFTSNVEGVERSRSESGSDTDTDTDTDDGFDNRATADIDDFINFDNRATADIDDFVVNPKLFEPIYDNASITQCGAYVAMRSCCLPFSCIKKLLDLLQLLCPTNDSLPRSASVNFLICSLYLKKSVKFVLIAKQKCRMTSKVNVIILPAEVCNQVHSPS
jgi:hypothetical protein